MNVLVTGAAGFIGSHLCEKLLHNPEVRVTGLDGWIVPHLKQAKQRNIRRLLDEPRFTLIEGDMLELSWHEILPHVDAIIHLAGMPGVRSSWGSEFKSYISHNIAATQRLLEGCVKNPVERILFASTSSVYGRKNGKVSEDAVPRPLSPYGVSKLTAEHLCRVYNDSFGLPVAVLRFFTVYGPRQREDMAFHRFIRQLIKGEPLFVNGDGTQTRDFTYVGDCVEGIVSALHSPGVVGETINIGGLERASVLETISILERLSGQRANIRFGGSTVGEPKHTWADSGKAYRLLGYRPKVDLFSGLQMEWNDLRSLYEEE